MFLIKKWKYFSVVIGIAFFLSFPKFYYAYFVNNPTNNALAFGDGYKQMVEYVKANENIYDRIYISGYYWRPYIFMLFWGNVNPTAYQNDGTREHFGKYYFTSASWDTNGIKLMEPNFNYQTLPTTDKTIFILSKPEYVLHQKDFTKIADINGNRVSQVFVAAQLNSSESKHVLE